MKRTIAIFIAVSLVLSLAGVSFARMGMRGTMQEMGVKQVAGVVEALDHKAKTLAVKSMRDVVNLSYDNNTTVKLDKSPKTIADVKVGDKVTITFEAAEGKYVAKNIIISLPPAAAPAEKKAEPKAEEKK